MKGKAFSARRRLSSLVGRADKLGVDLNNSSSAALLRQACGQSAPPAPACLVVLSLLALAVTVTIALRCLRVSPSHCPPDRIQELHIETLSWRLPRDEGEEPPGYRNNLPTVLEEPPCCRDSVSGPSLAGNWSWLRLDDCEDLDSFERFFERSKH